MTGNSLLWSTSFLFWRIFGATLTGKTKGHFYEDKGIFSQVVLLILSHQEAIFFPRCLFGNSCDFENYSRLAYKVANRAILGLKDSKGSRLGIIDRDGMWTNVSVQLLSKISCVTSVRQSCFEGLVGRDYFPLLLFSKVLYFTKKIDYLLTKLCTFYYDLEAKCFPGTFVCLTIPLSLWHCKRTESALLGLFGFWLKLNPAGLA